MEGHYRSSNKYNNRRYRQRGSAGALCFHHPVGMMHCLITDVFLFFPTENYWCIQTKGRGTLWKVEPKMDQVDAQVVLSVLFWEKLSCAKSRILIRGGSKPSGPKTAAKYSTQYKSKESAAKYSTQFKSKETAVRYILSNSILSNDP